jgi:hypothetical protein
MKFDGDLQPARAAYAGRHRKTPAYVRAASQIRMPHLTLPPLSAIRRRPRVQPASHIGGTPMYL